MLERLAPEQLAARLDGDGAGTLVRVWPSVDPQTGRVAVVLWNGTLDQGVLDHDRLHRSVRLRVDGLAYGAYELRHRRLDEQTSNLAGTARRLGVDGWPTDEQWDALRAADRLADTTPPTTLTPDRGSVELSVTLPMPSISLLELTPR
ncbi:hypothetical protein GCM10027614_03750 [Micromonospora vulcania]